MDALMRLTALAVIAALCFSLVLAPVLIWRPARPVVTACLTLASVLFGLALLLFCVWEVEHAWGWGAVFASIFVTAGATIGPAALLIAATKGYWTDVVIMLGLLALAIVTWAGPRRVNRHKE